MRQCNVKVTLCVVYQVGTKRRKNMGVWLNLCQRWLFLSVLWFTVLLSHPQGQVSTFVRLCASMCVFMCDPRQVPASMTRFHHLQARHISQWQLRARTLSKGYVKICVCVVCECMLEFLGFSVWAFLSLCTHMYLRVYCGYMSQNQCQSLFKLCYSCSDRSASSLGL